MSSATLLSFAKANGWELQKWNVILEGQSDVDILQQAVNLEKEKTQKNYSENFAFLASGEKDNGGVDGVWRQLTLFHPLSKEALDHTGKKTYRFIGLLDNDPAGRKDFATFCRTHQICECKEIFFMMPIMPSSGNLDPKTLKATIAKKNIRYSKIDWEIEDYFPLSFWDAFLDDHPEALKPNGKYPAGDMTHYELTKDGKASFHRYVKANAIHSDFCNVIQLINSLRFFMNAPKL